MPLEKENEPTQSTLGDVLYGGLSQTPATEKDWVKLVQSIAAGDPLALQGLYERTHRIVFTLIMRLLGNRETAEELTLEVFTELWRRAPNYDVESERVVAWVMNVARSKALDRLRFEHTEYFRAALDALTPEERRAIEGAFFSQLTPEEISARLNQPAETVRAEIRAGLHKLRRALAADEQ